MTGTQILQMCKTQALLAFCEISFAVLHPLTNLGMPLKATVMKGNVNLVSVDSQVENGKRARGQGPAQGFG